ncbi:MAG: hypothetical protein AAFQ92_01855, partial [Bacteroidota bacterium]
QPQHPPPQRAHFTVIPALASTATACALYSDTSPSIHRHSVRTSHQPQYPVGATATSSRTIYSDWPA